MPVPYASGKRAWGLCDRCGFRTDLRKLKYEYVKQRVTGSLVCPSCWTKDHPQLMLGTFPINDPQALRNPRPDQPVVSRDIQWGWNPVGMPDTAVYGVMNNPMVSVGQVGNVSVVVGPSAEDFLLQEDGTYGFFLENASLGRIILE